MKLGIVSDIHLLPIKDKARDFYLDDEQFCNDILRVKKQVDIVVLNGDVFDLWQSKLFSFNSRLETLSDIVKDYPKTTSLIQTAPWLKLISGNHDEFIKDGLFRLDTQLEAHIKTRDGMGSMIIRHGIEDFWNKRLPKISSFLSWIGGWLERMVSSNIEDDANNLLQKKLNIKLFKNYKQIKQFKKEIDTNSSLEVMINGHTHHPQIMQFNYKNRQRLFINTGFYNGITKTVTYINTQDPGAAFQEQGRSLLDYSKLQKSLKKGDVILTYNNSATFSALISKITGSPYSHAIIYLGNNKIIESTIGIKHSGVIISDLDKYLEGKHNLLTLRLKDQSLVPKFIETVHKELGSKYSYGQLFVDAGYYLIRYITGKDYRNIYNIDYSTKDEDCTELVGMGLEGATGKNYNSATMDPGDLQRLTDDFTRVNIYTTKD